MSNKYVALYVDNMLPNAHGMLGDVYDRIVGDRLLEVLFYDGSVCTRDDFLHEMLKPGTLPFVVMRGESLACFSWLNEIQGRAARTHVVLFRKFWGRKLCGVIGRNLYRYLLSLRDENGFLFDCLYGITPENNPLAWKAALRCGWRLVGTIPNRVFLADENKSTGGVVTVATREFLGISEGNFGGALWDA